MSSFKPLRDIVLLKPIEQSQETKSGLIITDFAADEVFLKGTVVSFGNKVTSDIKEGDKVIYQKYTGVEIVLDHNKYIMIPFKDISGVLTK